MTKFRKSALAALVAVGVMGMAGAASAAVVGGGATLPEGLYGKAKVSLDANKQPYIDHGIGILHDGAGFNPYVGVGSGSGKKAFFENDSDYLVWDDDGDEQDDSILVKSPRVPFYSPAVTVDFAGSDSLVSSTELGNYNNPSNANGRANFGPLIQVPSVLTSVTVPFNVPGLPTLNLTSEQLAKIFGGEITRWDDSQLGLTNAPAEDIIVVHRGDESGTTEIFLRHLNAVDNGAVESVDKDFVAAIKPTEHPAATFLPAIGSDGVVSAVEATAYSIGYVSPDKVDFDDATVVASINGYLPTEVNVQAAVEDSPVPAGALVNNPLAWGISNANPSTGYPIVASTNLIFSQCYADSGDESKIRQFFGNHYDVNYTLNDQEIEEAGFVKLPAAWLNAVRDNFWASNSSLSIGDTNVCNGKGRPL